MANKLMKCASAYKIKIKLGASLQRFIAMR
jgi:hypothetical protein